MKNPLRKLTLAILALSAPALPMRAQEDAAIPRKTEAKGDKAAKDAKAKANAAKAKANAEAKAKAEADAKAIDINSATKEQLKTLPGITDAYADKIIANRPYLSKAFLVTKNVLPADLFQILRKRIVARQPGVKPPVK